MGCFSVGSSVDSSPSRNLVSYSFARFETGKGQTKPSGCLFQSARVCFARIVLIDNSYSLVETHGGLFPPTGHLGTGTMRAF